MRSERSTDTEYLDETPWLDFGDTSLVSAMFQVTHNPAVLRAYGLTAPQTVEVWMATPEHLENDASAKFRLHGEAFLLSATDNVKVVPYPGIYFLKLSSGAGTIKVTLQHTEMGRHSRKPNVVVTGGGGGGGMTHEQNSDMALASGTANAVSAAELRAHLDEKPMKASAIAQEAIIRGQTVRLFNNQVWRARISDGTLSLRGTLGIATASVNAGNTLTCLLGGRFTDAGYQFSAGEVFLDVAAGFPTNTPPPDQHNVLLGHAENATTIFFNPTFSAAWA